MKPMFSTCCMLASLFALLMWAGSARADASATIDADKLTATVQALGRLNGQALACQHKEVGARIKSIMINRVPKTRPMGELFENATTAAFLAQGNEKAACPPQVALTVELEAAARPLAPPSAHQLADPAAAGPEGINPRYLLQASSGRAIMDGDFPHRFQLISFGYTFCPDICPTTLLEMAALLKQLGDIAPHVQPIFISVDPERDTPAHLHQYLAFFDQRIIGATGKPEFVKRAAESFKVRYEKVVEPGASTQNYAIDHSAGMYLLAPGGRFIAKFTYGMPLNEIFERLNAEVKQYLANKPAMPRPAAAIR